MSGCFRRFELVRDEDVTGKSGTGVVAWGVQFPDGVTVLRWATNVASTAVYQDLEQMVEIHGHGGRTRPEFLDGHQVRAPFHGAA